MALDLTAVGFLAREPEVVATFWGGLLGRPVEGAVVLPSAPTDFALRFVPCDEPRAGLGQAHFDLTSAEPEGQARTVARALDLGGSHLDIGQGDDVDHVVLADVEGNEFDVIPAGNNFLAGTAPIGCIASDGTRALGVFWAEALGWPLVWDEDEETAIQSPHGGSKISWGGPPLADHPGRTRVRLEVVPVDSTVDAEVERLVGLGASVADSAHEPGVVLMLDPDGNEFAVLPTQAGG